MRSLRLLTRDAELMWNDSFDCGLATRNDASTSALVREDGPNAINRIGSHQKPIDPYIKDAAIITSSCSSSSSRTRWKRKRETAPGNKDCKILPASKMYLVDDALRVKSELQNYNLRPVCSGHFRPEQSRPHPPVIS